MWTISEPGVSQMKLHFNKIEIKYRDTLRILDENNNRLKDYSNINQMDVWTEWFTGDTLKIQLITNGDTQGYGFLIDNKETRLGTPTPTPTYTATPTTTQTPSSTPIATSTIDRKTNLGPYDGNHKYYIHIFNVDDTAKAIINGNLIKTVNYREDSGWVEITNYLSNGENTIEFNLENGPQYWTYGFELKQDGSNIIWNDSCGNNAVNPSTGCKNYDQTSGLVYRNIITLLKVDSTSIYTPTYTPQPTTTPDTSPPSISLSKQIVDFNDNGQLEEGEKLDIIYGANDENGVKSIKVLLDGTLIDLRNVQGTFHTITDSLSMGGHSIVVEAIDSKENKKSEEMKVNVARSGPSVYFPKSKFEVTEGETFIVDLAAINPIGNPNMDVQLILKPNNGEISISGSDCESLKGMCMSSYFIEPGNSLRGLSVNMRADRVGEYPIQAEVYYQFENGVKSPTRYETFTLVVKPKQIQDSINVQTSSTPGFKLFSGILGLLIVIFCIKGNKKLQKK